jgi:hypothetical protein
LNYKFNDIIIKGFNILKYKPIGMFVVNDMKSVKPFSFD